MTASDNRKYEEIMRLPHHVSRRHPRMTMHDRAAQFAPFAALRGYDSVIQETGREVERRIEIDQAGVPDDELL